MSLALSTWEARNVVTAAAQMCLFALAAAILPYVFRLQHPKTLLVYNRIVLVLCFLLPVLQPWRTANDSAWKLSFEPVVAVEILLGGVALRLAWLVVGLWRVHRYRLHSMPLFPAPETITAAEVLTNANATYCVSSVSNGPSHGPVTFGWLFPVIVLPEKFLTLPEEAQCGIACHELLHVRRRDWLGSMAEEFAGSLLWFNPGAWILLAQARLAREQFVDQEAVRLTASREPYIEALLSFAKSGYSDLAPATSFLRRNHLTQRMHFLLQEPSMSASRLVASYASITILLGATFWLTAGTMPLVAQQGIAPQAQQRTAATGIGPGSGPEAVKGASPAAPVQRRIRVNPTPEAATNLAPPTFAQDPVNVTPTPVTSPEDRAAVIALLEQTRQLAKLHIAGTPSWEFLISFRSYGGSHSHLKYSGDGELTETWRNGKSWRWSAKMDNYSYTQWGTGGVTMSQGTLALMPLRAHTTRNAMFWAVRPSPSSAKIRVANVQWNGRNLTCLLVAPGSGDITGPRAWEEEELCIDPAKKVLQIDSFAPGSYIYHSYDSGRMLGGRPEPDGVQIYENGTLVNEARVDLHDLRGVEAAALAPPVNAIAVNEQMSMPVRFPMIVVGQSAGRAIVHASIDPQGIVLEADLSSATDADAARTAMDVVSKGRFPHAGGVSQTNGFIDIQFVKQ